jgi:predicted metal-binding membrane protein
MEPMGPFEVQLRRDRAVIGVAVALLCAAAWVYVVSGAGLGTPAWEMTSAGLPPQISIGPMAAMPIAARPELAAVPVAGWAVCVVMWWTMMIAMMAPGAAPAILLYALVARSTPAAGAPRPVAGAGWFTAGYLGAWLAFAAAAALAQAVFQHIGWMSRDTMSAAQPGFAAAVLGLAGLYQLSPMHEACLRRCRMPADFLQCSYRPGPGGALRTGLWHGLWCLGCNAMLMTLLFVGGVMNLLWIAALTALVAAEKVLPLGRWIGRGAGVAMIGLAASVLLTR